MLFFQVNFGYAHTDRNESQLFQQLYAQFTWFYFTEDRSA